MDPNQNATPPSDPTPAPAPEPAAPAPSPAAPAPAAGPTPPTPAAQTPAGSKMPLKGNMLWVAIFGAVIVVAVIVYFVTK